MATGPKGEGLYSLLSKQGLLRVKGCDISAVLGWQEEHSLIVLCRVGRMVTKAVEGMPACVFTREGWEAPLKPCFKQMKDPSLLSHPFLLSLWSRGGGGGHWGRLLRLAVGKPQYLQRERLCEWGGPSTGGPGSRKLSVQSRGWTSPQRAGRG